MAASVFSYAMIPIFVRIIRIKLTHIAFHSVL